MPDYCSRRSDLHIHTVASDGEFTFEALLKQVVEIGLSRFSVTDHDSIKMYKDNPGIFSDAEAMGVTLIPGVELDSEFNGVEVHVLGYGFNVADSALNTYLNELSLIRKQRVLEQIAGINKEAGRELIQETDIIKPYRETYMKPHVVHHLLNIGEFNSYRKAVVWLNERIKVKTRVPKPDTQRIVRLIKDAGGDAFIAHPGYFLATESLNLRELIQALIGHGLDGIELIYPYYKTISQVDTITQEKGLLSEIFGIGTEFGLQFSRGSDAHNSKRLFDFNAEDSIYSKEDMIESKEREISIN